MKAQILLVALVLALSVVFAQCDKICPFTPDVTPSVPDTELTLCTNWNGREGCCGLIQENYVSVLIQTGYHKCGKPSAACQAQVLKLLCSTMCQPFQGPSMNTTLIPICQSFAHAIYTACKDDKLPCHQGPYNGCYTPSAFGLVDEVFFNRFYPIAQPGTECLTSGTSSFAIVAFGPSVFLAFISALAAIIFAMYYY